MLYLFFASDTLAVGASVLPRKRLAPNTRRLWLTSGEYFVAAYLIPTDRLRH